MNKQRKVLITIAYNDLGCIVDTKAEPYEEPNLQPACNQLATDCISRQAAIDALEKYFDGLPIRVRYDLIEITKKLPSVISSAHPEVLACGEGVLNAQPETARRIVGKSRNGMTLWYQCEMCNEPVDAQDNFCRGCGRRLIDE